MAMTAHDQAMIHFAIREEYVKSYVECARMRHPHIDEIALYEQANLTATALIHIIPLLKKALSP